MRLGADKRNAPLGANTTRRKLRMGLRVTLTRRPSFVSTFSGRRYGASKPSAFFRRPRAAA